MNNAEDDRSPEVLDKLALAILPCFLLRHTVSSTWNEDGTYTHVFEYTDKLIIINAADEVGKLIYLK